MIAHEVRQYLAKVAEILNSHDVEYIVVGGAAVSYYGYNRPSGFGYHNENIKIDLDFWYNPTEPNFQRILKALTQLHVDVSQLQEIVFDKKKTFLKIPHESFHIDFLPIMVGLGSFRSSRNKAIQIEIEGITVHILSFEDLIANKKAVNRRVDVSDIDELNKLRERNKGEEDSHEV